MLLCVLVYHVMQNFDGGNFDGYLLFKYLTENVLMDGHYTLVNAVKLL